MDPWKYYDIIHRYHTLMNPVNDQSFNDLIDLLELPRGARVTDIGCGKGEMLIRLGQKYRIKGVGVDLSPYCISEAKKQKTERVPDADLKFLEMKGSDYKPDTPETDDLTMCIGASWIFDGYKKTLMALSQMTKPLGRIMVGEPFWRKNPPQAYLKKAKLSRRSFNTHRGNVTTGEELGLAPVYALVSSESDWDRYEGLHWYATRECVTSHPDDPDLKEILKRDSEDRQNYLKYERDLLGWAIYLFQKKM